MSYSAFIDNKLSKFESVGFDVEINSEFLFDFQAALVRWAVSVGRCALFADTGLGKTRMQLAWANNIIRKHGGAVLILSPLAVAEQTRLEGEVMGIDVTHVRETQAIEGICITNYERVHKFDCSNLSGVILDESSIIKHHDAKTFSLLASIFRNTPYKLCATATPAPNDWTELGTHAEFLGVCSRTEMLSEFFIHDAAKTQDWRLKGHARSDFWRWVSSWASVVRNPADIGFDGSRYELPALTINHHVVKTEQDPIEGQLFALEASTLSERRTARRNSVNDRVSRCADIVNSTNTPWVVWCELNNESEMLTAAIDGAVEVRGSMTLDQKESALMAFQRGESRVIVTKPKIAGFGLNWQHCHKIAFVGVTDSYESYYQAIRRCWRFGQDNPVDAHVFASDLEGAVVANLGRKESQSSEMVAEMAAYTAKAIRSIGLGSATSTNCYKPDNVISLPEFICAA